MSNEKGYTVDNKEEVRRIGKNGKIDVFYRIWATTTKGTYFHVDVPEEMLGNAHEYLEPRAKALDAI